MNETVKNIIDKVKTTAHKTSEVTVKKTGEIWEITKLTMRLSELNSKTEQALIDIGEIVYDAFLDPNSDTEHVDSLLDAIHENRKEIRDIKERIDEIRQVKLCHCCDKKINREDTFCKYCGEKV